MIIFFFLINKLFQDQTMEQHHIELHKEAFIKNRLENINDYYHIEPKKIGKGTYGTVFKGYPFDNPHYLRAIKRVSKKKLEKGPKFTNQVRTLRCLDHPGISRLYESFEDDKYIYLVLDLCQGSQLFEYLCKAGHHSQYDARVIFKQIIEAISYCHKKKISHRDLKPENFMFLEKGQLTIKLIDFGLAYHWKNNMLEQLLKSNQANKIIGTAYYIAPEVLQGSYDQKCDIWSAGVILYMLLTAVPPFDGQTDKQILEAILKRKYSLSISEMDSVSTNAKDLIFKILKSKQQRLTIEQIFKHPWMNEELNKTPIKLDFSKMKRFSKFSKLKAITATYAASQIPDKCIQKISKIFQQIDKDHDGYISLGQLCSALQQDQGNQEEIIQMKELIQSIDDVDKFQLINYTQFIASNLDQSIIQREQNLEAVFKMLDKDHTGTINKQQILSILQYQEYQDNENCSLHQLLDKTPEIIEKATQFLKAARIDTTKQLQKIFNECNLNNDGKIDFEQFKRNILKNS